mmetsp:Transcript_30165/g.59731  ORF Transcript_30165/g.59731 Transcript_30165/m.59731 type:complete len:182 (+) Transcript_30165:103-648(+)
MRRLALQLRPQMLAFVLRCTYLLLPHARMFRSGPSWEKLDEIRWTLGDQSCVYNNKWFHDGITKRLHETTRQNAENHGRKITSELSGTLHSREDTKMICFISVVVAPFGSFAFLSAVSSKCGGSHYNYGHRCWLSYYVVRTSSFRTHVCFEAAHRGKNWMKSGGLLVINPVCIIISGSTME